MFFSERPVASTSQTSAADADVIVVDDWVQNTSYDSDAAASHTFEIIDNSDAAFPSYLYVGICYFCLQYRVYI